MRGVGTVRTVFAMIAVSMTAAALAGATRAAAADDVAWTMSGRVRLPLRQDGVACRVEVDIDRARLAAAAIGDELVLPLPDGSAEMGVVTRRTASARGRVVVSGPLGEAGSFTIAVSRGAVYGHVRREGLGALRLRGAVGRPAVLEIMSADGYACDGPVGGLAPNAVPGGGIAGGGCGGGPTSVIDIIVCYTPEARAAAGGVAEIEAAIATAVEDNNIAWANSGVPSEQNLVLTWGLDTNDDVVNLNRLTNPNDGWIDEVHDLRDLYGADQVVLIVDGFFGVANGLFSLTPDQADNMFCIVGYDVFIEQVFAHEQGHNMGCCHAVGDGGGCGVGLLFPYSNGHRFMGNSGTFWRTIMAYPPGSVSLQFSSPLVDWDGVPTGTPDADNALTMLHSHAYVADFFCPGPCDGTGEASDGPDCNENGIPDTCDIASGNSTDDNGNGVPDDCEDPCDADVNSDGDVDVSDLVAVTLNWGPCEGCVFDIDLDGDVGVSDMVAVILVWGFNCN
ncbi:MAG: hypothetical protein ACYTGR_11510 [Planctomycetota bacterium]